jgi:hypothetical protein
LSNYTGPVTCKDCGSSEFAINDWETYCSVICARCEHKIGELAHPPYDHYGMRDNSG